jgi:hypothetical protein
MEEWKPNLLKETVFGFVITESDDGKDKYINTFPLEFYWFEGISNFSIPQEQNVKGVVSTPYPTYRVSFTDPDNENIELGYELPNGSCEDWFLMMASHINGTIEKENDEKRTVYLNECRDKCLAESERHKSNIKNQCEFHDEQIELG